MDLSMDQRVVRCVPVFVNRVAPVRRVHREVFAFFSGDPKETLHLGGVRRSQYGRGAFLLRPTSQDDVLRVFGRKRARGSALGIVAMGGLCIGDSNDRPRTILEPVRTEALPVGVGLGFGPRSNGRGSGGFRAIKKAQDLRLFYKARRKVISSFSLFSSPAFSSRPFSRLSSSLLSWFFSWQPFFLHFLFLNEKC